MSVNSHSAAKDHIITVPEPDLFLRKRTEELVEAVKASWK